jgi:hypothetical protein
LLPGDNYDDYGCRNVWCRGWSFRSFRSKRWSHDNHDNRRGNWSFRSFRRN